MAVSQITDQQLGLFLQIAFSEGIRVQIAKSYRDWEMVLRNKVGAFNGRQLNFMLQSSFGPSAIQYRGATQLEFPSAQQISVSEHVATVKEIDATVEIEYNLWNRARKSPAKYAEPLALEIQSKSIAARRRLAADLYGDGTGVVGTAASATVSAGKVDVVLSSASSARGHIGFFEFGDLLVPKNADGTAANPTVASGTFFCYRVVSRSRSPIIGGPDSVKLEALSSSGAVLTVTASGLTSGDVFYRVGQLTGGVNALDLTGALGDYGTLTEVYPGLETLVSNDGRVVHGITMSGATAGSVYDHQGASIGTDAIQILMDQTKLAVGEDEYAWKMLAMAPETHSAFVSGRETDRRFHTVEDNKRGIRYFAYQHGNDTLECYTSEFVPKKRIYALPEAKAGNGKVLELHGTDFETVKVNDSGAFHLKPGSGGGHQRKVASYMEAMVCLICKHPAAIGKIVNFVD